MTNVVYVKKNLAHFLSSGFTICFVYPYSSSCTIYQCSLTFFALVLSMTFKNLVYLTNHCD